MAITKDVTTTGGGTSPASPFQVTWSHTCTGSNLLLTVSVQVHAGQITGITYNGTAMTQAIATNDGTRYSYIYYLVGPATGAHNVVVTFNTSGKYYELNATSWAGVIQTGTLDQTASGSGTSKTTVNLNITPSYDNELIVDGFGVNEMCDGITVGTGQTQLHNDYHGLMNAGGSYTIQVSAGVEAMGWTIVGATTNQGYVIVAASFKAQGTGTTSSSSSTKSTSSSSSSSSTHSTSSSSSSNTNVTTSTSSSTQSVSTSSSSSTNSTSSSSSSSSVSTSSSSSSSSVSTSISTSSSSVSQSTSSTSSTEITTSTTNSTSSTSSSTVLAIHKTPGIIKNIKYSTSSKGLKKPSFRRVSYQTSSIIKKQLH